MFAKGTRRSLRKPSSSAKRRTTVIPEIKLEVPASPLQENISSAEMPPEHSEHYLNLNPSSRKYELYPDSNSNTERRTLNIFDDPASFDHKIEPVSSSVAD